MKKIKLITTLIIFLFTTLLSPNITLAADLPDCEFTGSDPLNFCINNFDSPNALQNQVVKFDCVKNCGSNWLNGLRSLITHFLTGSNQTVSLKNFQVGENDGGSFTCLAIYDWDESVLKTVKQCMNPKLPDIIASEPGCLAGLAIGIPISGIGAIVTGGMSIPITMSAVAGSACAVSLADVEVEVRKAAADCAPQFKVVVENSVSKINHCKVDFGYDILPEKPAPPVNACQFVNPKDQGECQKCMGTDGDGSAGGIWTGLGCLSFSPTELIKQILQIAVGLGGGIAFLLLLYGAFLMTTSAGNPEAADNAKQIITGAITGLLIIIFSVVILNIVGVQILQIPGL